VHEDDLVYFDFRCPKCKKANRVSKEQLLHSSPGWKYEPTETGEEKEKPKSKAKPKK
jgi:phage FluMu protein Com